MKINLKIYNTVLRSNRARDVFIKADGVKTIVDQIKAVGANGNAQQLYDFGFCLWTLSLGREVPLEPFLVSGAVRSLSELVAVAPSRKVVRVAVAALKNLAIGENDRVLTEMLTHGLQKTLENFIMTGTRLWRWIRGCIYHQYNQMYITSSLSPPAEFNILYLIRLKMKM